MNTDISDTIQKLVDSVTSAIVSVKKVQKNIQKHNRERIKNVREKNKSQMRNFLNNKK